MMLSRPSSGGNSSLKDRVHSKLFQLLILGVYSLVGAGCSRLGSIERKGERQKQERIDRCSTDRFYTLAAPAHTPRTSYPWEVQLHLPRITKDFFRCKGNRLNPPVTLAEGEPPLIDCEGCTGHGLPVIYGKEGVYPILIDLLNYLQQKTAKRVIVTCGHRCPMHNQYVDPSKENRSSKHQIGAEADFYIQGMEDRPLEVVGLIMQFFQEILPYSEHSETYAFKPYERGEMRTRIQPWINKELLVKIFSADEGRDGDNTHPYPYISVQVRFDRHLNEPVVYSWEKAHRGYPRGY